MGTRKFSSVDYQIGLLDREAADGSLYRKIATFASSSLLSLVNSVMILFRFIVGRVFRINSREESSLSEPEELNRELPAKEKGEDFMDLHIERRMPAFSFKYQTQNLEENLVMIDDEEEKVETKNPEKIDTPFVVAAGIHNQPFLSDKDVSSFMEEAEKIAVHVRESLARFEGKKFDGEDSVMGFLYEEDFMKPPVESILEEEDGNSNDYRGLSSLLLNKERKKEDFLELKYRLYEEEKSNSLTSETNSMAEGEFRFLSGSDFESDTESSSSDGYSVKELMYDSDFDDFLLEKDFGEEEHDSGNREQGQHKSSPLKMSDDSDADVQSRLNDEDGIEEAESGEKLPSPVQIETGMEGNSEETSPEEELTGKPESELGLLIEYVEDSSDDELSSVKNGGARVDSFGEVHFVKDLDTKEVGNVADDLANSSNALSEKKEDPHDDARKGLEVVRKKAEESEAPDMEEELDELWEHQDLIEQLKMELKKVRAAGLPTIPEESDSPSGFEDLKPFRINLNFLPEDPLDELQNFYKSYRERMRKLDILNYQKLYAMGFAQMKNSTHSFGIQGKLFSAVMSHFSQNLFFCYKKFETTPSEKLIDDLQRDLETVYVGQTCLSWEFLRWQYEKSHELLESDARRSHRYNQVADEFQQFQVLIQRFTENEPFQGPRLQNYVQQRCVFRNLLQVPFMKEDFLKENFENRESENAVTGEMLEDVMEKAIDIFWEFVKAEKHETPLLLKILIKNNVEVQEPSDYLLMEEIQSDLQKKEKKLKDLQRSGNCIVKKFKKPQEDRSNQDLFFSQIDLKLVSRVLKMSRISSDQLSWCHRKLSKINFSPGKVHRAPSFLLFPC
ncbi:hypothetical protein KSP39_PZI015125 [Platanthera zijinensis]|uniref:Uncharacterized protein n=1 Tax=Platanthera zijinensis TaxID=2320716 RepID=A0AAP0BAN0_9ASPA